MWHYANFRALLDCFSAKSSPTTHLLILRALFGSEISSYQRLQGFFKTREIERMVDSEYQFLCSSRRQWEVGKQRGRKKKKKQMGRDATFQKRGGAGRGQGERDSVKCFPFMCFQACREVSENCVAAFYTHFRRIHTTQIKISKINISSSSRQKNWNLYWI